jgi:hypothetical protein
MHNFQLLEKDIEVGPLVALIHEHPELWNTLNIRKGARSAHIQVNDIIIRFDSLLKYTQGMECIDYPAFQTLSQELRPMIDKLMQLTETTTLGRVVITRLDPGRQITTHIDSEKSASIYKRFHLCLEGHEGNQFTSGDETVEMRTGEFWWFDNKILHGCINKGVHARTHLILDII